MQANTMTTKRLSHDMTTALVVVVLLVNYHDYLPVQLGNLRRGKRFSAVAAKAGQAGRGARCPGGSVF